MKRFVDRLLNYIWFYLHFIKYMKLRRKYPDYEIWFSRHTGFILIPDNKKFGLYDIKRRKD